MALTIRLPERFDPMHDEIELKLLAPPETLERIRNSPAIRSIEAGEACSRRLVSTYFDTPRNTLRKAGVALRIRQHLGGFEQTVKAPVAGPAGLQTYREWNGQVLDNTPCVEAIEDREIRAVLKHGGRHKRLEPRKILLQVSGIHAGIFTARIAFRCQGADCDVRVGA